MTSENPAGRSNPGDDEATEREENPSAALPAIQLSEDFKLPIIELALAEGAMKERSPEVQRAAENVKTMFYRELAQAVAKNPQLRRKTVTDPDSGEETIIIEPSPETEAIKSVANQRFRALFGDAKYNAYSMRTALERMAQDKSE